MAETIASADVSVAREHRANLRQLQEEMIVWLYAGTGTLGLALVLANYSFPQLSRGAMLGMAVMLVLYPLHRLLARHYWARAWLLVALWLVGGLAATAWLPASAPCLFTLPVVMAVLLLGCWPGLLTALAASALAAAAGLWGAAPFTPESWAMAGATLWGTLALIWLWLHPLEGILRWSWQRYDLARCQAERARETQAELKQAVKDLAEGASQMARLNQLLGAARRAAEEAERAKAEFVANVSHELRTPLNMIIGFSEMMLQAPRAYGRLPRALQADLAVILRNSQHLAELIDDVLDLSQIEAGRMALTREPTVLHLIVEAASEAIRPLYQSKGLTLTSDVPEDILLLCDRTRIREVLLNLLSNAGRFTEQGGVHIAARVEGSQVVVSVADTGQGIAPEDQARLFQPFQQVDGSLRRRYGGSGLGLAISRHFVELHGGRMWMDSRKGQGTTIYFSLPMEPAPSPGDGYLRWLSPEWEYRQRTRRPTAPAPVVRPRLVIVEKGTLLVRLLRRYLRDAELVAVSTLAEAGQELARAQAQALVVSDLAVGQAMEQVRQAGLLPYGMPAFICALPEAGETARSLGVDDYLVKPVSREALLGALDRVGVRSGTVLIVDDELDAIQLFWRLLAASGRAYRVLTAANGEQGLAILQSERPDAILLDLVMPTMDGFRLLDRRKEEPSWRDVPVIVMSARDQSGQPVIAQALGIMRGGGLTVPQLLAYMETLSGPLAQSDRPGHPAPAGAPPD